MSRPLFRRQVTARVWVMYSAADAERFTPVTEEEKREMRESLFPDWMTRDAFVLGWVGKNRWRKQVWVLYKVIHYSRTGKYLVCGRCGKVSLFDWDPLTRGHADETKRVLESRPNYKFDVCTHCCSAEVRVGRGAERGVHWMGRSWGRSCCRGLRIAEPRWGSELYSDVYPG